ncbi:MBL fold metallo-hydrolase [Desertivirga xinjiangensis]|uniref:MBL fold metallo-hydrolase n=1 Tax=Desertivirga xinjiangensis TaxID=539206 RepID=UPI00210CF8D7|nr:MBL fold metallo-hydrolase [Pedobacter xinjiangensis]
MKVQQFENKYLAQYSYAILSENEKQIVLIDPSRDPEPYFRFADDNAAEIIGVIETHPHADFVSSHLEIQNRKGAKIYASKLTKAIYAFYPFDEGDVIEFGKIRLRALNTPGHSPDSLSVVLEHQGIDKAVFTGDTLFVGDCGRPDLREAGGDQEALRGHLAKQMYFSLRGKLASLADNVVVYPAHGAGSLCGKALSEASSSTIGAEKKHNWSLQEMQEHQFVEKLTSDLPFIPAYFPYNVDLNKKGAPGFSSSVENVNRKIVNTQAEASTLEEGLWIVDVRDDKDFKKGHLSHSVNIMDGDKFETWLGSIIRPGESFYLAARDEDQLMDMLKRSASIGYEAIVKEAFVVNYADQKNPPFDLEHFRRNPQSYTIVDVRNATEVKEKKIFPSSIAIPLGELRERIKEIPADKPVAVHCAGGYRSAAASSLLSAELLGRTEVYDIGEAIRSFN